MGERGMGEFGGDLCLLLSPPSLAATVFDFIQGALACLALQQRDAAEVCVKVICRVFY